MASEDPVENLILRKPPVLAVPVDGVRKLDELNDAFETSVPTLIYKVDSGREDLVVHYTRRKTHVAAEKRHDNVPKDLPMRDLQDEHALVPRFGKDCARAELLRSHFQELSSVPVLIQKELRLDEVTERSTLMPLERHADAAFTFNEAG